MLIDCHGHYTTAPKSHDAWRQAQIAALAGGSAPAYPSIGDDEIRASITTGQLPLQQQRGIDLTIFSPRASAMAHHIGGRADSERWTTHCNDLIHRVCQLFPQNFIGVAQLPQSPGVEPKHVIPELRRTVEQLGFVGCNLNPDPSGGMWTGRPLTDKSWYPVYEALVDLDVPAMIHVSASCNDCFHTTGAHYLNADTTAFMQLLQSNLFKDFPRLKFIIPHGGGAVPYHWGRFRGLAQEMGKPLLTEHLLHNVFFDTCVYHQPGLNLLTQVIPVDNILFATEMLGAVRGIDPETGHHYDDTGRYVSAAPGLSAADRAKIFEGNARRVYGRLSAQMRKQGVS